MADPARIVVAECPACRERRFRATGETLEAADVLTCESCGLKLSYGFLQSRMDAPSPPPQERPRRKAAKRRKKAISSKRRKRA